MKHKHLLHYSLQASDLMICGVHAFWTLNLVCNYTVSVNVRELMCAR